MFGKRYQSFDEGDKEPLPAFRRLSKAAQPVPGTIVVGCVVCGARFQKRLDCEFFQCDSCGALVTHAGGSPGGYSAPPAPPMNTISVVVQQPEPRKKKKKKKKKSSNSSSSDSCSSDSSAESAKRKRRDKRRLRALEQQVQSLQSRGSGDQWGNALGQYATPGSDVYAKSDIYASRTPWPASAPASPPARRSSAPQLMDSWSGPGQPSSASGSPVAADGWPSMGSQSSPWPAPPSEELYHDSPSHRRSAEKNTKNPFTGDDSSWPNSNDWPSSPSQQWPPSPASKPWPPQSDLAVTVSANPFGDPFGQRSPVTVNVPREIASMSSDQLLLLAQAKRCVEQAQEQGGQEPLQLQFTKNCRKDSS